jgi:ParB-like chromosome segregation protein Spo0J
MANPVNLAFSTQGLVLPIAEILPLKPIRVSIKSTQKYQQILASIREVGVIEPLIVFPNKDNMY